MVLRGVPMSQIDLQKLTQEKPRIYPYRSPNNSLKMGKQMLKLRLFLRKLFPKSLKSKPKVLLLVPSTVHQLTGLTASLSRSNMKKSIQKKMMIQNSWLWTQPFSSLASSPSSAPSQPSSQQIRLIGYGLITLLLVGLVGGFAFYLMYYFVYQYYGPDMDRSQRPPFWKSVLVILASMFLWLLVFFATSFLPASLNPVLAPLATSYYRSGPPSPSLLSQETLEYPQRKCRTNTLLKRMIKATAGAVAFSLTFLI